MITWSAGIPEQEDLADDGDISAVTNGSETQQGLDGALANAGVLPRSAWGARPTRCTSRDRAKERMAIHHTAGAPTKVPTTIRFDADHRRADAGVIYTVNDEGSGIFAIRVAR